MIPLPPVYLTADEIRRALPMADAVAAMKDAFIALSAGRIELGDVLSGRAEGRRVPEEITLFKSVGSAIQDLYAAARAVANARRLGLGTPLPRRSGRRSE